MLLIRAAHGAHAAVIVSSWSPDLWNDGAPYRALTWLIRNAELAGASGDRVHMPAAEPARVRDGLPTDAECVLFTPVPVTLPSERMPWPRLPVVRCRRAGSGSGRQRSADHRADGRIEHMLGEPEDLLDPSVAAAGDQNQAESADVNHERLLGDRPEEQHPWQRRQHSDAGRDDPRPGGRDDLATRVLPCWWARAPAPRGSKARRERRRCSGGAPSRPPACTEAGSLPSQTARPTPTRSTSLPRLSKAKGTTTCACRVLV